MTINEILQIITIGSAILLVLSVILQQRGATLGAGMGGSGELYTTRRGVDKSLFEATVVISVIFVVSILAGLLIPA